MLCYLLPSKQAKISLPLHLPGAGGCGQPCLRLMARVLPVFCPCLKILPLCPSFAAVCLQSREEGVESGYPRSLGLWLWGMEGEEERGARYVAFSLASWPSPLLCLLPGVPGTGWGEDECEWPLAQSLPLCLRGGLVAKWKVVYSNLISGFWFERVIGVWQTSALFFSVKGQIVNGRRREFLPFRKRECSSPRWCTQGESERERRQQF